MPEDKYTPQQPLPEQTRGPIETRRWIAPPGSAVKRQLGIALVSDAAIDENTVTHVMTAPRRSLPPDPAPSVHSTPSAASRVVPTQGAMVRSGPLPARHAQELPSVQELMNAHVRSPEPVGIVTSLDAFGLHARRAASGKAAIAPIAPSATEQSTFAAGQHPPAEVAVTQEFSFNVKDFVAFEEPTLGGAAKTTPQPQSRPAILPDHSAAEARDVRGLRLAPEDEHLASARRPTTSKKRAFMWLGALVVALACLVGSDYRKDRKGRLTAKLITAASRIASPGPSKAAAAGRIVRGAVQMSRAPSAGQETPQLAHITTLTKQAAERAVAAGGHTSDSGSIIARPSSNLPPREGFREPSAIDANSTDVNAKPLAGAPKLPAGGAAHSSAGEKAAATEPVSAVPSTGGPVRDALAADASTAAELLANGRVREALSEYRVLATLHPELRVYGEIAKILRRRLINTCKKAQPHRQQECEAL